jgi:hypothetical protein
MCGLSDSVETGLDAPRRKSVGARKPGRMQRVERTNVVESIVKLSGRWQTELFDVVKLQLLCEALRLFSVCMTMTNIKTFCAQRAQAPPVPSRETFRANQLPHPHVLADAQQLRGNKVPRARCQNKDLLT